MFDNLTWPVACVFNVIGEGRLNLGLNAEADVEVIKAEVIEEAIEVAEAIASANEAAEAVEVAEIISS